jgi:hypothetical protein
MAHLHLGLLAYWVVNTVRYQLKRKQPEAEAQSQSPSPSPVQTPSENTNDRTDTTSVINFHGKEIIRIMNTQKAVLTVSQNRYDEVIITRRCSDPTPKVDALNTNRYPLQNENL